MRSETPRVELEGGKYVFEQVGDTLVCYRHGETWRDFAGDKAVYCLFDHARSLELALGRRDALLREALARLKEMEKLRTHDSSWWVAEERKAAKTVARIESELKG